MTELTQQALNRATLDRQPLLRRQDIAVAEAVEHLVGMQAQIPLNPYVGLWSRLRGFEPHTLAQLLVARKVVRIVVMRSTIHLRPLMRPVLDKELNGHPEYGAASAAVDKGAVLDFVRALVADKPHSGRQLRAALEERFPEHDAAALAYASRNWLPFVQVSPRGRWGESAQVSSTTAESWLGRPLKADPPIDDGSMPPVRCTARS